MTVDGNTFAAPLLIAADGANSQVRQWAGIGLTAWQYRQHCLLATVTTEKPAPSGTWQQFYPTGPRAFYRFPAITAALFGTIHHKNCRTENASSRKAGSCD